MFHLNYLSVSVFCLFYWSFLYICIWRYYEYSITVLFHARDTTHILYVFHSVCKKMDSWRLCFTPILWSALCSMKCDVYDVIGNYRYSVNICWIHKLHSFFCPYGRLIFLNTLEVYIFFVFAFCQVEHLHNFILFRFSMGFIDSIIAKCKYALKEIVGWNLWGKWGVIDVFQS